MKKKQHIQLTPEDRIYLQNLLKGGSLPVRMYKRATALLELDRGSTFTTVAQLVGVSIPAASSWAQKYRAEGLAVLQDKPRPGRPTVIDGIARAKITALACSDAPAGYSQWSLRLLADKAVELGYVESVSYTEVSRILKKMNSSPISNDSGASVK